MLKDNKERLYEVLRSPIVTEKSTTLAEDNKVVFEVAIDATKHEIKNAIEFLFDTKVDSVSTITNKGKVKVFKGKSGKRKDTKKAIVKLKSGHTIDLATEV